MDQVRKGISNLIIAFNHIKLRFLKRNLKSFLFQVVFFRTALDGINFLYN